MVTIIELAAIMNSQDFIRLFLTYFRNVIGAMKETFLMRNILMHFVADPRALAHLNLSNYSEIMEEILTRKISEILVLMCK